jgi:hypothetical protein
VKKTLKPATREEATYYSDFSGKCFGEFGPPIELTISCSYGSKHDGAGIQLHLDDEELKPLLEVIKKLLSEDYKNDIKKTIERLEKTFDDSMQMRDWEHCDIVSSNLWFWRELLGLTNEEEERE